jgi:glucan 1,3-beta-glucosidase
MSQFSLNNLYRAMADSLFLPRIVVGEWTAAITDCAPALNRYGIGARFDGTFVGSIYTGSYADKNNIANWNDTFKGDM